MAKKEGIVLQRKSMLTFNSVALLSAILRVASVRSAEGPVSGQRVVTVVGRGRYPGDYDLPSKRFWFNSLRAQKHTSVC